MSSLPIAHTEAEGFDLGATIDAEQRALLRLACRLGFRGDDAADLVQATFADAWEKRAQLRDSAAMPGWLRQILVRRAMSLLRRRKLWAIFSREQAGDEPTSPGPEARLERAETFRNLQVQLSQLPVQQRTAFTLRYVEGLAVDEVASAMGIERGTARIHLYRALKRLRISVEESVS